MTWLVYPLMSPIDFGWEQLKTVADTAALIGETSARNRALHGHSFVVEELEIDEFLREWESAKAAASSSGWQGDFRHDPVVFWVPSDAGFTYGFVIKQDNNGETYVVSKVPLPYLESLSSN